MIDAIIGGDRRWCVLNEDCRSVIPRLPRCEVVTDPPWPEAPEGMFPGVDSWGVWGDIVSPIAALTDRLVVVVSALSDPRFVAMVPPSLRFCRLAWLRRTPPGYYGTRMISADVAYIFGHIAPNKPRRVLPGEVQMVSKGGGDVQGEHPCPRNEVAMVWLIDHFTRPDSIVFDPFCGSGTTGIACLRTGRRFIGCEINPTWAALSIERMEAEDSNTTIKSARHGQEPLFGRTA